MSEDSTEPTVWMRSHEVTDAGLVACLTNSSAEGMLIGRLPEMFEEELLSTPDMDRIIWPTVLYRSMDLPHRRVRLVMLFCCLRPLGDG